jgi:allantoinase
MSDLFTNCRIPSETGNEATKACFRVDGGKFVKFDKTLTPIPDEKIIDLDGNLVIPGGIDPHVHFNTPGFEERETFEAGSTFAAMGGITTVIDMPCTSLPPVTTLENLKIKLRAIGGRSHIDFALWGGVSGNCLIDKHWRQHMAELWSADIIGFKTYSLSGMATFTHLSPEEIKLVIETAGKIGALVGHHAEDAEIVLSKMKELIDSGRTDPKAYADSRPASAEIAAIERFIHGVSCYRASGHIVHISTGAGAEMIGSAKRKGIDISGETCPHYLAFSEEDLIEQGSVLKTAPVVKTKDDSARLWKALSNGDLAFIASDHAPCPAKQKQTGSIWTDYGGISGTGTLLPYMYSEGFRKGRITLAQLVDLTSTNAAKRFGFYPKKGSFQAGSDADFVIIDERQTTTIHGKDFPSKGKLTPFENRQFAGKIVATYLRGSRIYSESEGVAENRIGKWIRRKD